MLTFDARAHAYRWKGAVVPGVTSVLRGALGDGGLRFAKPDDLARARDLGTAVHRMIELEAAGDLDESSLVEPLPGYLMQWRAFVRQTGFTVKRCELQLYSLRYGYAGTLDLLGDLGGDALLDTKAGAVPRSARPQTAAYAQLLVENGICATTPKRYVLDLKPDRWSLSSEYRDPNDIRLFLAALTIHRFKEAA